MRAALVLLTACRLFTREVNRPECIVNDDCARDQLCFVQKCTERDRAPAGPVYVRIVPNVRQPYFPQHQELPRGQQRLLLRWTQTSQLRGRAITADGQSFFRAGTLKLLREPVVQGLVRRFETTVEEGRNYELNLEPGTYTGTFALSPGAEYSVGTLVIGETNLVQDVPYPRQQSVIRGALKASANEPSSPTSRPSRIRTTPNGAPVSRQCRVNAR